MKVPIRTLSQRDVDILARCSFMATVSKGYVEQYDLRWSSPSLREWELRQRNLKRSRKVEVLIDELNVSEVFVILPAEDGHAPAKLRATSTRPQYTQNLSLYEHQKLKAAIKAKHLESRLSRMEDSELFRLRTEYYALLGRQEDPIAARRLEKLRDQLAERRLARTASDAAADALAAGSNPTEETPAKPEAGPAAMAEAPPSPPRRRRRRVAAPVAEPGASEDQAPRGPEPPPRPPERPRPEPPGATPPVATPNKQDLIYPVIRIKRTPR